jgi:hypothetical protein
MRYRCISVLEEYICTQDYTPFGGPGCLGSPAGGQNVKNFTPKPRGLRPLGSGSRGPSGPQSLGHCFCTYLTA